MRKEELSSQMSPKPPSPSSPSSLSLASLPPIFIIPTHFASTESLHAVEDTVIAARGSLTYSAAEARIFLGKVRHAKRAGFEIRSRGVFTVPLPLSLPELETESGDVVLSEGVPEGFSKGFPKGEEKGVEREVKRRKIDGGGNAENPKDIFGFGGRDDVVVVLRLDWLDACVEREEIVAVEDYVVYRARVVEKLTSAEAPSGDDPHSSSSLSVFQGNGVNTDSIMERAKADAAASPSQPSVPFHRRKFGQKSSSPTQTKSSPPPKLYRATTTELDGASKSLPPVPPWMDEPHPRPLYSCLRSTPPLEENPNRHFIAQLTKIKEARLLTLDEIGVRAYSTSIASLSAYLHRITSPLEITRLPGCNDKIASLWIEWHDSVTVSDRNSPASDPQLEQDIEGNHLSASDDAALDPLRTVPVVRDLENDKTLTHLRLFHQIWGVGPDTARKFYLQHGWTDLDDVVEFGWSTLSRVQQIGVKFFDEFQQTIPRAEVEAIARVILKHARLARSVDPAYWTNDVVMGQDNGYSGASSANRDSDPRDFVAVIVGGYRRGKSSSGDVDVILSHRDERLTQDLIIDLVASLESAGYITHTLTLHTSGSDRGQSTLPFRADGMAGHGFDSLDKALCVWQDPNFSSRPKDESKNPNIHRRVDIIISPWRTVGCAVLGWSGGTTFQRDLRRWVKRERGWKYDSSGIRERGNGGRVLDLESPEHSSKTEAVEGWEERERRLMENIGIGWRAARERCTG